MRPCDLKYIVNRVLLEQHDFENDNIEVGNNSIVLLCLCWNLLCILLLLICPSTPSTGWTTSLLYNVSSVIAMNQYQVSCLLPVLTSTVSGGSSILYLVQGLMSNKNIFLIYRKLFLHVEIFSITI
jgi:hypothetical protein